MMDTAIERLEGAILVFMLLVLVNTANAAEIIDCDNCTDCTAKIQNATAGDTVRLTANITDCNITCIDFDGKDWVTFDGGGYTIDGTRAIPSHGITLSAYSDNNVICNCTITDFWEGVYLYTSSYNTIENVTVYDNRDAGLTILYGRENVIRDCLLQENSYHDFHFRPNVIEDCNTTLTNVTGSGGRQIGFYTGQVNLQDSEFSSLCLCNASGSTLHNITIAGSDCNNNNGLRLYNTDDVMMTGIVSSDNFEGISIQDSSNVTITNSVCDNSHHYNIFARHGTNNTLRNISVCGSSQCGVYLYYSPNNTLTEITASGNPFGILLDNSGSTVMNGSTVTDNLIRGMSGSSSEDNLIYDNYFDNTENIGGALSCVLNTTPILGTNIVGGPSIGGNYWNNYTGNDTDGDGFGDTPHDTGHGFDQHPLVEPLSVLCGDVDENGHVSANDVVEAYRRAVDPDYPVQSEWAADADGNGYISANDVVEIYQTAVDPNHPLNCILIT